MNELKTAQFIRQHLDQGADHLSYKTQQRLQAGRQAAVRAALSPPSQTAVAASEQMRGSKESLFSRFAMALPALALVAGLYGISQIRANEEAEEIASVDTQLMLDDVPVNAYADHGFGVYIKNTRYADREMRGE
jgi:Protein of unknown function (DUF3619)